MDTKTRLMVLAVAAPDLAEPEYNNPYDERGDAYIPTPGIITAPVTGIGEHEGVSGGEFENNYGKPVTAKGVCWSTEEVPTLEDDCTNDGQGLVAFKSTMTGLQYGQVYYVRAYATNEDGTGYGGQRSFKTLDGRPEMYTHEAQEIRAQSARISGEVHGDDGVNLIRWGICYSEDAQPTTSDTCLDAEGSASKKKAFGGYQWRAENKFEANRSKSQNSSATTDDHNLQINPFPNHKSVPGIDSKPGLHPVDTEYVKNYSLRMGHKEKTAESYVHSFYIMLVELSPGHRYFVRTFAISEARTSYGPQIQFITRDGMPVVATSEPLDVTGITVKAGGQITDDGGANITDRGVCYSTVHTNPTMQDECLSAGSGTGSFEITLSHLESITKYHLRAYAQNEISTGYGSSQSFRTNAAPVEDIDGNAYPIVEIGDQIWMAENLRTTRYQNGQTISTGLNNTDWENSTSGAYAVYPHENISGLYSEAELIEAYGKLYNWHSVNDNRGLCPSGWRIPSDDDWTQLVNFVVSQGYPNTNVRDGAANALKSRRQDDSPLGVPWATSEHPRWNFSVRYGIDVFSFSGLPGGYRTHQGSFGDLGSHGSWWSSSESSTANAWRWRMSNDSGNVGRIDLNKRFGLSVRCLRD